MNEELEKLRQLKRDTWNEACHLESIIQSAKRRLKKFPLWRRVVFFFRFLKVNRRINHLELQRASLEALTLSMVKRIRKLDRELKNAKSNS